MLASLAGCKVPVGMQEIINQLIPEILSNI